MKRGLAIVFTLMTLDVGHAQTPAFCSAVVASADVNKELDKIRQMRMAGHFDAAAQAEAPLLQQYPTTFRVLYVSALNQADKKNWSEAQKQLESAISLQNACISTPGLKPDYTVYNTLGWIQMTQGQWAQAETNFKLALQHSADLTAASIARTQSNLGYLYLSMGDFANAKVVLSAAANAGNANAQNTLKTVQQAELIYRSARQRAMPTK